MEFLDPELPEIPEGPAFFIIRSKKNLLTAVVETFPVELLFKFLKRTLLGLHLFNYSPNGVEIHFYSILTTAVLQLHFKQQCTLQVSGPIQITHNNLTSAAEPVLSPVEGAAAATSPKPIVIAGDLVQAMGKGLQELWKVGIHWLRTLRS